jgi:hypothetical protein
MALASGSFPRMLGSVMAAQQPKKWWDRCQVRSGGIVVEIVESERDWGQRVDSVQHFSTTRAAQAFVDGFNKATDFSCDRYTVARLSGGRGCGVEPLCGFGNAN